MKGQRSNSRNEALLDAAAHLFASQGFKATSVRDIAKAVDMLPGSIYYHFSSKDDLLLAVYEAGVAQISETFEQAILGLEDPWQRLQAGVAALIRAVTQESAYTRVIFKVTPGEVPTYEQQLVAQRDQFEAKFRTLVDALPLADWVNPHLLRLMVLGAGNHTQLWFSPDGEFSAEQISEQFCRFVRDNSERSNFREEH